MRQVLVCVAVWVVSVASPPVARAQRDVVVTTLTREDHVLVSLELRGAYTEEVRDTVASGLETTFSFDIELRQPVAFWLDRTVDRVSVSARVRYDGLIGRYRVTRVYARVVCAWIVCLVVSMCVRKAVRHFALLLAPPICPVPTFSL